MSADFVGWVGSIAFALCGLPQAWECYKHGSAKGISPLFIALWFIGEICYVISVLMKFGWVSWMMFNYLANLFSIVIIVFYLVRDRSRK